MNKNLPAIIPTYKLTEETTNIVCCRIDGGAEEIFCESVDVVNGWIIMKDLRIKKLFLPDMKPISVAYSGNQNIRIEDSVSKSRFLVEGYLAIANRTIPEKAVATIDSYSFSQQDQLPLWVHTDKAAAVESANEKVIEHNKIALKRNHAKFQETVTQMFNYRYYTRFLRMNAIIKWAFRIEYKDWFAKQKKTPEARNILENIIEHVKKEYECINIEYEGVLEFNTAIENIH